MAVPPRQPGQPITGFPIGKEIAEALGLPCGTTLIQIRIGLDDLVEVICRYYPDAEAMERVHQVLQRYHVIPADEYSLGSGPGRQVQQPIKHSGEW